MSFAEGAGNHPPKVGEIRQQIRGTIQIDLGTNSSRKKPKIGTKKPFREDNPKAESQLLSFRHSAEHRTAYIHRGESQCQTLQIAEKEFKRQAV